MSYDLLFAPTPEESRRPADEDGTQTPPAAEVWQRVVNRAQQLLGPVEVVLTAAYGEVDHEPTGIQLFLTASFATITAPYGATGDEASAVLRQMYTLGAAVEEETGLIGYDPQLDRPLQDAARDLTHGQATFDLVGDMLRRRAETERRAAQRRAEKERG